MNNIFLFFATLYLFLFHENFTSFVDSNILSLQNYTVHTAIKCMLDLTWDNIRHWQNLLFPFFLHFLIYQEQLGQG